MKNYILVILAVLLISSSANIAAALTAVSPVAAAATGNSKPATLSILDQLLFSAEPLIVNGVVKAKILVNRITKKVEYVWSDVYRCYVRAKYSIPNIQTLYDSAHAGGKWIKGKIDTELLTNYN